MHPRQRSRTHPDSLTVERLQRRAWRSRAQALDARPPHRTSHRLWVGKGGTGSEAASLVMSRVPPLTASCGSGLSLNPSGCSFCKTQGPGSLSPGRSCAARNRGFQTLPPRSRSRARCTETGGERWLVHFAQPRTQVGMGRLECPGGSTPTQGPLAVTLCL